MAIKLFCDHYFGKKNDITNHEMELGEDDSTHIDISNENHNNESNNEADTTDTMTTIKNRKRDSYSESEEPVEIVENKTGGKKNGKYNIEYLKLDNSGTIIYDIYIYIIMIYYL